MMTKDIELNKSISSASISSWDEQTIVNQLQSSMSSHSKSANQKGDIQDGISLDSSTRDISNNKTMMTCDYDNYKMLSNFAEQESLSSSWNAAPSYLNPKKVSNKIQKTKTLNNRKKNTTKQPQKSQQLKRNDASSKMQTTVKSRSGKRGQQQNKNQEYITRDVLRKEDLLRSETVHLQGGLVISSKTFGKDLSSNNSIKQTQQTKNRLSKINSLGQEIQCTRQENHIFNGYFLLNTRYVNESVSLNNNNKQIKINKQITKYLQSGQLEQNRKTIQNIISDELSNDISLPFIISQRESFQNQQIINYIDTNFTPQTFYSFHVFSSDFQHQEVNLKQLGFSHKLLSLLNFNYQSCSLSQCQVLIDQFFSIEQFESLQFDHFNRQDDDSKQQQIQETNENNKTSKISINTFDQLSINCNCTISMVPFQYPQHINNLFSTLNERVYFIQYNIDRSHILNICNLRNLNLPSLSVEEEEFPRSDSKKQIQNKQNYEQVSQLFVEKYYSEEHNTHQEIKKINQAEELERMTSNIFNNLHSNQRQSLSFNNENKCTTKTQQLTKQTNLSTFNQSYYDNQVEEEEQELTSQNLRQIMNNQIKNQDETSTIRRRNTGQSQSFSDCSTIPFQNYQNNPHLINQNIKIADNHPQLKNTSHLQQQQQQQQQQQKQSYSMSLEQQKILELVNNKDYSAAQIQFFMQQLMNQQASFTDEEDEDDDDEDDDIDVLLLKIELVKRYQQQMRFLEKERMQQMQQQQMIEERNQQIQNMQQPSSYYFSDFSQESKYNQQNEQDASDYSPYSQVQQYANNEIEEEGQEEEEEENYFNNNYEQYLNQKCQIRQLSSFTEL